MTYNGSCHCGNIQFQFTGKKIKSGLRCNCSICIRKGAIMTEYTVASVDMKVSIKHNSLSTYTFAKCLAKHHFCSNCGIYTFHQSMQHIGVYRMNIGCIKEVDALSISVSVFDGAVI